ncbi:MAG: DUF2332 family protein, partial [Cyanobacteria bacterium REEB65]|nr:DUF2332 family protein [Cyanobacteria bacterium REEB65]
DHVGRFARLESALAVRQSVDLDIRQGDAVALLSGILAAFRPGSAVCVYHTAVTYQFSDPARQALEQALVEAGKRQPVWCLSCEATPDNDYPLVLSEYSAGACQERILASCDPHGVWIEWW